MDPIDNPKNYLFGIFYYNPNDPRTVVPKRLRWMGYTMNFAKPLSIVIFILILLILGIAIMIK